MGDAAAKVPPQPDGLDAEFYERAAGGTLHVQRCSSCGTHRHPPRYMCAACGAPEWEWVPVSGRGTVHSWTVSHRALDPGWVAELPYATLSVELEEGVRMIAGLRGLEPAKLAIGLPVRLEIEPAGEAAFFYCTPV